MYCGVLRYIFYIYYLAKVYLLFDVDIILIPIFGAVDAATKK